MLLLPVNFLVKVTIPSSGIISISSSFCLICPSSTEKVSSTRPFSAPFLKRSELYFPPRASPTEPSKIDFPAPVSPVNIFNPCPKSTSVSSIKAIFFTCRFCSIPFTYTSLETIFLILSITAAVSSTVLIAHMIVSSPAIQPTTSCHFIASTAALPYRKQS